MRFLPTGPDIPLELISAQEKGQTISSAALAFRVAQVCRCSGDWSKGFISI
jgi:hypothetical protein